MNDAIFATTIETAIQNTPRFIGERLDNKMMSRPLYQTEEKKEKKRKKKRITQTYVSKATAAEEERNSKANQRAAVSKNEDVSDK